MTKENTVARWDAFLSYASQDRPTAKRIQRFLEAFNSDAKREKLRVFLDVTDIRSGELDKTLADELRSSRKLILCASHASADSHWVDKEFALFRTTGGDENIGVLLISGEPNATVPPAAEGGTYRWHDIRNWRKWWPFGKAHLEMLRLLAFVADVELRSVVNWQRRRMASQITIALLVATGVTIAVANYPMETWGKLTLAEWDLYSGEMQPIACEIQGARIWTAARIEQDYALGWRNYIVQFNDAVKSSLKIDTWIGRPVAPYRLGHRLLPTSLVDKELETVAAAALDNFQSQRTRSGDPFVGRLPEGPVVVVQRLSQTERELAEFQNIDEHRDPLPGWGSVVVVQEDRIRNIATVADLIPKWKGSVRVSSTRSLPSSPSRGIAVAWDGKSKLWLAVGSWDNRAPGGLWASDDLGVTWKREDGIQSASDVAIVSNGEDQRLVLAQSAYDDNWSSIDMVEVPPQLKQRAVNGTLWEARSAPAIGNRSEIEICGESDGSLIIRVDRTLYKEIKEPLWRWFSQRASS